MKRRAFLSAVAVATSGCLGYLEPEEREEITNPEDVVIVRSALVRENPGNETDGEGEPERVYIQGVGRNEGDRELNYVEIRATFLGDDGEELDTVIQNVPDVTSDEEWSFEIEYPRYGEEAARVDDYELEVATSI